MIAIADHHAVFSPDFTETGTNAVSLAPPVTAALLWQGQFRAPSTGSQSCRNPVAGRACEGVARDVDEPEDLDRLDGNDPDLGESTVRWSVATTSMCYERYPSGVLRL